MMTATAVLSTRPQNYHSYMVRLWRDQPQAAWRATAQCVQTGAIYHFVDMAALTAFLETQVIEHSEQALLHPLWAQLHERQGNAAA